MKFVLGILSLAVLDEYIKGAGIENDRKGPLFRSVAGKPGKLTGRPRLRMDVWRLVHAAADAGIETSTRVINVP